MRNISEEYVLRHEHNECQQTIELYFQRTNDEQKRQNKRIDDLEETVKQFSSISISVEKLALNMENMLKEQVNQGKRLQTLEDRDGAMWRKMIGYILSGVVGIIIGFVFKQIGM